VGTSGDYPPFSLEREGRLEGLDVDVARRFARDSGRRLELVRFRWPELTRDLAAGRFELAMGGVTMRPERAVIGVFTRPIATAGAVVLARERLDPGVSGLRLGVNTGGHLERVAARLFPRALLVRTSDNRALGGLLESGAVEAILTDDAEADALAIPGAVRLGPFTRDHKAYLGRDPALVAELDAWLRAREIDGTLAELRARWLGPARGAPRSARASDDLLQIRPVQARPDPVGRHVFGRRRVEFQPVLHRERLGEGPTEARNEPVGVVLHLARLCTLRLDEVEHDARDEVGR